jgi:DNA polymerase-3 subunit beta
MEVSRMELKVDRAEFSRIISRIQGIVERKNTMPVLANCLIKADKEGIALMATDLDITLIDRCAAKVKKTGNVSLNARKLHEIFRELEEGEVEFKELEPAKVELKSSHFTCALQGINPEEFPVLPTADGFQFVELEAGILSEMIAKTIYAAATEEGRFTLNGIFMEKLAEDSLLRFVATDGHRMAAIDRQVQSIKDMKLPTGAILPKKGMIELQRLIGGIDGKVSLGVKENHVAIKLGDTLLFMRLVDGEFPEYKRVIPEKNPVTVTLGRDDFLKSLRRTSVLVDEKARAVKLIFSKGKMVIESSNPSYGIAKGESECEYDGTPLEIGFNDRYLYDILTNISAGKIKMEIKDELSPVLFTVDADTKYQCVIMPMRI